MYTNLNHIRIIKRWRIFIYLQYLFRSDYAERILTCINISEFFLSGHNVLKQLEMTFYAVYRIFKAEHVTLTEIMAAESEDQ